MALLRRNLLGLNAQAIAATEAQYADTWAQDAAAMYGYAGSSASATSLTPSARPGRHGPRGAGRTGRRDRPSRRYPGRNVQSSSRRVPAGVSAVPNTLQGLATPAQALSPLDALNVIADLITIFLDTPAKVATLLIDGRWRPWRRSPFPWTSSRRDGSAHRQYRQRLERQGGLAVVRNQAAHGVPGQDHGPDRVVGAGDNGGGIGGPGRGQHGRDVVGAAHVDHRDTGGAPPRGGLAGAAGHAAPPRLSPPGTRRKRVWNISARCGAGMAGRAMAGTSGTGVGKDRPRDGGHTGVPAGGTAMTSEGAAPGARRRVAGEAADRGTGVAAESHEFAQLRDEGILTEEEYTEQKNRLLGR